MDTKDVIKWLEDNLSASRRAANDYKRHSDRHDRISVLLQSAIYTLGRVETHQEKDKRSPRYEYVQCPTCDYCQCPTCRSERGCKC